ncbi:hypothetical protein [Leptolyngbya sp. 7M]|uniref:hypothetical protein n=1 Tax=Leptolyngbya sp. 7M TaxID=2812896 RepID=UPI001B8B0B3B|nr:hypothetical protein [Leptolyngbya sp. 7M]QYO64447.1 hypothetical protein JVX88_33000 [Leptolyngbya sp. 7M]QYU69185.1 hypothetical protein J4558_03310 [Leptolyngbya sp. 15MV]
MAKKKTKKVPKAVRRGKKRAPKIGGRPSRALYMYDYEGGGGTWDIRPGEVDPSARTHPVILDKMFMMLESVLKRLNETERPSDTALKRLWTELTPDQRALLGFAWKYESTGLTYSSIATGSGFTRAGTGPRYLSDKSIQKCAKALFDKGLLARSGDRSFIQLTAKAHELVEWAKADARKRSAAEKNPQTSA